MAVNWRPWILEPMPQQVGRSVRVFASTDSTNQRALELSDDPANEGLVLLAEEQTEGRGQYGRVWTAPRKSSVLLSALVFPPVELRRPALLTSLAAVAVTEAVRELCNQQATIKWPNDVFLQGKKVCGILIEQRGVSNPNAPLASVLGIGLNLSQSTDDFRRADLPLAGSLLSVGNVEVPWEHAAERLIRILNDEYARLLSGELHMLESRWKERLGMLGKMVAIEMADCRIEGRLLDVGFDGVMVDEDGDLRSLAPETIRRMTAI